MSIPAWLAFVASMGLGIHPLNLFTAPRHRTLEKISLTKVMDEKEYRCV